MKQDWKRLAKAVKARRLELELSQTELATAAGIGLSTLQAVEATKQTGYRRDTLRDLARALGWSTESIKAVLAGGDATVTDAPTLATVRNASGIDISDLPDEVQRNLLEQIELHRRSR